MAIREEELYQAWHTQPHDTVIKQLRTSIDGLTSEEAGLRLEIFGLNKLVKEEKTPLFQVVIDQFKDPLIYILLIAGTVTILLQDYTDASVIFAVVILNAVIGFVQEFKAEESIRALAKLLALKAIAIRDGFEQEIDAEMLVPGDIILLQSGQKVPADLRLIQVKEFNVDESAFTGESMPASKTAKLLPEPELQPFEQKNIAFMGSIVTSGRAIGVVVSTGRMTQLGQISEEVRAVGPIKTPLQGRIDMLSRYVIIVTVAFGLTGLVIGFTRGENIIQLLLAVIAMAVATVPEGLPIALTIALAVAVNRMAKKNAIIRHLPAIETLGSSTVIGSDKTGTLTRNEMTVQRIWAGGNEYQVKGIGYEPYGAILSDSKPVDIKRNRLLEWTLRIGLLVNESSLIKENGLWKAHGDPTEVALIVSAYRSGMDEENEKVEYPQQDILPFESEIQYMATLNVHDNKVFLLVKGAPEKLLAFSKNIAATQGDISIHKTTVTEKADEFASQGLRVLGMAYKEMPSDKKEITHDDVGDLIFLGIQGMMDPPRPEAIEAIAGAKLSGIRVIMVTGDNKQTALSIAKMMDIAGEGDIAITGKDLDRTGDKELKELIRVVPVFARVSPHHKLKIVNALKDNREIVAVTGDGVNDAAALRAAHIGVAMGLTGTDVAKEASDMVVVDDNFASIYQAIIEGRVAFDNIRKVTYFLLTTGAGGLIAIFITIITELPLILLPAQILWVNLVTNGLQDVALAFDPKEPGVENRSPRKTTEGILNRTLALRLAILGLIIAVGTLGIFIAELMAGTPLAKARTIALNTLVFAQFFHVFNSRSEITSVFRQNPLNNRFLFLSILAAFTAQMALLYLPIMQTIFRTTALSVDDLLISIAIASSVLVGSEFDKWRLRAISRL